VDNDADLAVAIGHRMRYAQGRRFGGPLPKGEFGRLLADRLPQGAEYADE